jgi:hypothetical protein
VASTFGPVGVTIEARRYAAQELGRRAGVTSQMMTAWRTEVVDGSTHIYVQPGSPKRITIPACTDIQESMNKLTRAGWMQPAPQSIASLVPDFVLPHTSARAPESGSERILPLFQVVDQDSVACSCDVLCSVLLTLARYEEVVSPIDRDDHGRFPANASVAGRCGYLHRPVVDEYGFAFAQALAHLLPSWKPQERALRVKLSHDVDLIGIPFSLKASIGHTVRRRSFSATARDFLSLGSFLEPAYLRLVRAVVNEAMCRGLDSSVYWQACGPSAFDSGYDLRDPKVRRVIAWLMAQGAEIGIHPSYGSFRDRDKLGEEVRILRSVTGLDYMGGRQHYLRWHPESWADWESCGLSYDSTVGYADRIGFRCGTCLPYHPWLIDSNREAGLLEIPLLVMDETLADYMQLDAERALEAVSDVVARCRLVGGVFTLLWHNSSLLEPRYGHLYSKVLEIFAGSPKYDWQSELARTTPGAC